jgi:hypothetical protein
VLEREEPVDGEADQRQEHDEPGKERLEVAARLGAPALKEHGC